MKNVNFDNPYLFLLAIPLILAVIIPFIIAIRKENRQKTTIASFIIHIVISVLVTFAAVGTIITEIKTETTVYVVADVSYSTDKSLDLIDEYIDEIKEGLPRNSKLGVICFGKGEPEILYYAGDEPKSVKESMVDNSATDISSALLYASRDELFPKENIKRVVLITDGKDTAGGSQGTLVSATQVLEKKGIKLDAVFVDSNIKDENPEIQISDLQGVSKVFANTTSNLNILLQANYESDSLKGITKLEIYQKLHSEDETSYQKLELGQEFDDVEFLPGFNQITVELPQRNEGVYDYKIVIIPKDGGDYNSKNNEYTFTQEVSDNVNMLIMSGTKDDLTALVELYKDVGELSPFVVDLDKNEQPRVKRLLADGTLQSDTLPFTVEALSRFDEVIISGVDVRNIPNITSFMHYLEIVVSSFGKSLITMGNLEIQNKNDVFLGALEEMLPVNYGNKNADKKLYTLVLDTSHSINQAYKFRAVKESAKSLVSLLNDEDYVAIVSFSGEVKIEFDSDEVGKNRDKINNIIDGLELGQGTLLGTGLETAYKLAKKFEAGESQIMVISDGKTSQYDVNAREVATRMKSFGIVGSTINVSTYEENAIKLMQDIATLSGGTSYFLENVEQVDEFIFSDVADQIKETIIEKESFVHVKESKPILDGINGTLPPIYGYVQMGEKADATVYLTVDYQRNESEDSIVRVPLYSTREYGNGKVSTFASSLSGNWLKGWDDDLKKTFFTNMINSNLPKEKINYPYTVSVEKSMVQTKIIVTPADVRSDAKAYLEYKVKGDNTTKIDEMTFDSQRYYATVKTDEVDIYDIKVIYTYDECPGYLIDILDENGKVVGNVLMENGAVSQVKTGEKTYHLKKVYNKKDKGINGKYEYIDEEGKTVFTMTVNTEEATLAFMYGELESDQTYSYNIYKGDIANVYVQVPYLPEYDSYATFTPSALHASVNGQVVKNSGLKIEVDEGEIEIYEKPLNMYLLAIAVILFVADVGVRVLKFKRKKKGAK